MVEAAWQLMEKLQSWEVSVTERKQLKPAYSKYCDWIRWQW